MSWVTGPWCPALLIVCILSGLVLVSQLVLEGSAPRDCSQRVEPPSLGEGFCCTGASSAIPVVSQSGFRFVWFHAAVAPPVPLQVFGMKWCENFTLGPL